MSHGSNLFLPNHYCHMWRVDRIFFSRCIVNAQDLTCLYMRRCPEGKVPTLMPLGELVLHMGGTTHHHNALAPWMTGAFSEAFTLCHSQQRRPSKSVLSRKEWQPMLASAFMPWSQAKVEQAIGPRMRRQRISSGRCGLANRNIGRHSNAA